MPSENQLVTLKDIQQAREVIAGKIHRTPMMVSTSLGARLGIHLHLKAEMFQKTGSFKPRGALNKLNSLSKEEKVRGVISISAGRLKCRGSCGTSRRSARCRTT